MTSYAALATGQQAAPDAMRRVASPLARPTEAAAMAENTGHSIVHHCGQAMQAAANSVPGLARDLLRDLDA